MSMIGGRVRKYCLLLASIPPWDPPRWALFPLPPLLESGLETWSDFAFTPFEGRGDDSRIWMRAKIANMSQDRMDPLTPAPPPAAPAEGPALAGDADPFDDAKDE